MPEHSRVRCFFALPPDCPRDAEAIGDKPDAVLHYRLRFVRIASRTGCVRPHELDRVGRAHLWLVGSNRMAGVLFYAGIRDPRPGMV